MSIIRVQKTDCFAQIPNSTLQDGSISLEAKGLLCFMLSKPTDWTFYKSQVMAETGCSRDRFNRMWNELIKAGYLRKYRKELENLLHYDFILHDTSTDNSRSTCFQSSETQATEVQATEDPTTTKTDLTKTDFTKTDLILEAAILLISRMQEIRVDSIGDKFPETTRQANMMAVLVRQHGEETVGKVMEWAMNDSWWASHIITPTMLHKHFGKLKLQSNRSSISNNQSVLEQYLAENTEENY